MTAFVGAFAGFMWGPWLLLLLLGAGFWLTIRLRGIQFRFLYYALRLTFSKEKEGKGDISHFGSLMTALAATVGIGNIAGVSTAVALGGPGAIFWMWITGLVGMATKYSESFLAVKFRRINDQGKISGGPMYYLGEGLKIKWLGICFAMFGAFAAFGIGNMVQANTTAIALGNSTGLNSFTIGIFLATLTGLVIIGGIKRISEVSSILVPFMVAIYFLGALIVILNHIDQLGSGIKLIFEHAFTGTAATGGFAGATLANGIRYGVARGLFSNESGMGSAPIVAAAAKTNHPCKQALVSMTGTFLDTLIVCSITAMVISVTGAWTSGETGVALTTQAFSAGLPGIWGKLLVTIGTITFAFSTILAWEYYGEKCFEYLFRGKYISLYQYSWVAFVFIGTQIKLEVVWNLSDVMNALMAIPNLIGLVFLSKVLVQETGLYERNILEGSINKYD